LLQGWQHERVVKWDGREGRVILVIPDDPATHLKKVNASCKRLLFYFELILISSLHAPNQLWLLSAMHQLKRLAAIGVYIVCLSAQVKEICGVVEDHLGLCKGWLLSSPYQVRPPTMLISAHAADSKA